MVNTQLKSDPFEGTGQYVFGERFVGRKQFVLRLQKYCTTRNFAIQGLPKIGKTSLAYHSVINQKALVKSDKPFCPVFFDVGACDSADNLFKQLAFLVYQEAKLLLDEKNAKRIDENYQMVIDSGFTKLNIQNFFMQCIHTLPVNIVVVFDEFDKVRTIGFQGSDFGVLRSIPTKNIHFIINSKRSIFSLENWKNDPNRQPSNFYTLFELSNTIHLSSFDDDDMKAYWDRLKPYYDNIGIQLDEQYRKEIESYAGRHPYLLDVFNQYQYTYYEEHKSIAEFHSLRPEMKRVFDSMLDILKTEDLLNAAAQAIIGPVYDLDEEQKDRLENYGFIRCIQIGAKRKMLGADFGYSYVDATGSECAYIAPSEYLTLYMKGKFASKPEFWPNWSATIGALRQLMVQFFIDNFGENWESEDFSTQPDAIRTAIDEMKNSLQKDINLGFTTSPLIEYLMEGNLCQIIYKQWDSFVDVFSPLSERDFYDRFEYLKAFRNHPVHVNEKYLSEENKQKADHYLEEIKKKLDDWLTKPDKQKLTIQIATKKIFIHENDSLEGVIEKHKNGIDHSIFDTGFPFHIKIQDVNYVKSASNIGKKVRFVVKKDIYNQLFADEIEII